MDRVTVPKSILSTPDLTDAIADLASKHHISITTAIDMMLAELIWEEWVRTCQIGK